MYLHEMVLSLVFIALGDELFEENADGFKATRYKGGRDSF